MKKYLSAEIVGPKSDARTARASLTLPTRNDRAAAKSNLRRGDCGSYWGEEDLKNRSVVAVRVQIAPDITLAQELVEEAELRDGCLVLESDGGIEGRTGTVQRLIVVPNGGCEIRSEHDLPRRLANSTLVLDDEEIRVRQDGQVAQDSKN